MIVVAVFDVWGVVINVVSSALTGSAVWLIQRVVSRRRLRRKQRFFGLSDGADCLLVVNRHPASRNDYSVNRTDVFALLELSALLKECGARSEVLFHDQVSRGLGRKADTIAHLRWRLPGLTMARHAQEPSALTIRVGGHEYPRVPDVIEYVALAKIVDAEHERPVFLVCGQTATTNQAAVGYLVSRHRALARTYGSGGRFCLVLRVIDPLVYGPNMLELVRDVTDEAFAPGPAALADAQAEAKVPDDRPPSDHD